MRVIDINEIIKSMENQTEFVLRCEEEFHDRVSGAVAAILNAQPAKHIVALTGPSGSGKTTTAFQLKDYLENLGVKVCMLSMDNFFYAAKDFPPEANGDMESPYCVNRELLHDCMYRLSKGETVKLPWFDFKHTRPGGWTEMQGSTEAVILAEGIHMLNPLIYDPIRSMATGIYVAPRTRIITEDECLLKPEQIRVARRMVRDYRGRGHSLRDTVERAQSVDHGETRYIAPFKGNAEIHLDTFHDYEICALAGCLRQIDSSHEELTTDFMESHGLSVLQEMIERLPPLETPYVPLNSIIREFMGGSRYQY